MNELDRLKSVLLSKMAYRARRSIDWLNIAVHERGNCVKGQKTHETAEILVNLNDDAILDCCL